MSIERRAEAAGEVDALDLAAGERLRRAVEREVAEPDLLEIAEAREDRFVGELRTRALDAAATWRGVRAIADRAEEVGDGELIELGEGAALPFPAERLGLEALAAAVGARIVGAVARRGRRARASCRCSSRASGRSPSGRTNTCGHGLPFSSP